MRTFANLFLVLFFADGFASLLDEFATLLTPIGPLTAFRTQLALAVLLIAVPLYIALGIDRRLPKRLFLPLIGYVFFCPLLTWLFPSLAAMTGFGFVVAAVQLALAVILIPRFRNEGTEPGVTLPESTFYGPFFSPKNTLLFAGVNVVVVPLAAALFALYSANTYAAEATGGFMRVTPRGLYMMERVYQRGNRTVRLAAMIHVGEKRYYEDVARLPVKGRAVVLAEGVTDDKELLKNRFDYRKVASLLGLSPQEKMLFAGKMTDVEALEAPEPPAGGGPEIVRADVDLASFRPETMIFLNEVGKSLRGNGSVAKAAVKLNSWAESEITPQKYDIIMDDILLRRNKVVLGYLDKALKRHDTVVIPWGALHMKGIEAGVLERGFVKREERQRLAVDFGRMIPLLR